MQRLIANAIKILLVGINGQNSLGIGCFVKSGARTKFPGQAYRSLKQIILDRFKGAVRQGIATAVRIFGVILGQIVGVIDDADTQGSAFHGTDIRGLDWIVLIIKQGIERAHGQIGQAFELVQRFDGTQVKCGQRAQGNFAVLIVDVFQRLGRQRDFQAQIALAHGRNGRIKRTVRIAVINVLNVNATCAGALLHHQRKQFCGLDSALANGWVFFILRVQLLEPVLVLKKRVVQARHIRRRKQRDVAVSDQALVQQPVDLHPVIHMTDAIFLNATVVLEHQQRFNFQMPHGKEQGRRAAAHATLGAAFDRCLKVLVKGNAARMLGFAAANGAADCTNAARVDADAGALRYIAHDCAGRGVDRIQAIAALDQHARAELARGRTNA